MRNDGILFWLASMLCYKTFKIMTKLTRAIKVPVRPTPALQCSTILLLLFSWSMICSMILMMMA